MTERPDSNTQHILHWASTRPGAVAAIEGAAQYTYGDLAAGIVQHVGALRAAGIGPGMLVALESEFRYLHLLLVLACETVGAASVSLAASEIAAGDPILARCDAVIARVEAPVTIRPAIAIHLTQATIDRIATSLIAVSDFAELDVCPPPDRLWRLLRSSGSTGAPKAMGMTWAAGRRLIARSAWDEGYPERAWNIINLYDFTLRSSLIESLIALRAGLTVAASDIATAFADIDRFDECRMTLLSGDATRLLAARPATWFGPRPCFLRVKGGPMTAGTRAALLCQIADTVSHVYGASEVFRVGECGTDGVVRLASDVAVRVVGEDGAPVPPGQAGVIEARASCMVDAYLWDEDATRAAFRDGWYCTGDRGCQPASGQLVLLGRSDDLLNIGGVKIAPLPLEDEIRAIGGVAEVVLAGFVNAQGQDELHAVLELDPETDPVPIHRRVADILGRHVPYYVARDLGILPRTETGKVRRAEVRAMLGGSPEGEPPG